MKSKINLSNIKNFVDIDSEDSESVLERKAYVSDLKIDETAEKEAVFKMSCAITDDDGDMVMPEGCNLSRYKKNAPLLWDHQWSSLPIGVAKEIVVAPDGVYSKNKFGDTAFANDVWSLVKLGAIRTCSVGFVVKKALVKGTDEFVKYVNEKSLQISDKTRRIITDWKLYENSLVNIPANEDAIVQAISTKSLKLDGSTFEKLGLKQTEAPKTEEVKVEVKTEEVKVEVKAEVKTEEVKIEAPKIEEKAKEEPKVEPKIEEETIEIEVEEPILAEVAEEKVKKVWVVVREGDYKLTEIDKKIVQQIKKGKIL